VRPGRAADHSPPSSAEVLEEWSYTSTPVWAKTGCVTGLHYFTLLYFNFTFTLYLTPLLLLHLLSVCFNFVSRDSSVGIATGYGLDGLGIESR
jgi:hypothetical protein